MANIKENAVMVRVKFSDEEFLGMKSYAKDVLPPAYTKETKWTRPLAHSFFEAVSWFTKLPPKKHHRFFYQPANNFLVRNIWFEADHYSVLSNFSETVNHSAPRVLYTATVSFLIYKGYL